jgi:hypothetical protein
MKKQTNMEFTNKPDEKVMVTLPSKYVLHQIVVTDDPYERMYTRLKNGERYVKTFRGVCPHKNKEKCKCKFSLNFLENDVIMSLRDFGNGMQKFRIYKLSELM